MHEETRVNLRAAMRDEAFAHGICWLSGVRARAAGQDSVADLFERAATAQRDHHFSKLAELSGLAESVEDLLAEAIRLESKLDYADFARQAQAVGDTEAAELLTTIQAFREAQLEALRAARMRLQLITTEPATSEPSTTPRPTPEPPSDQPRQMVAPKPQSGQPQTADEAAPAPDHPSPLTDPATQQRAEAKPEAPAPADQEPSWEELAAGIETVPATQPEAESPIEHTDLPQAALETPPPVEQSVAPGQTQEEYRVLFVDKQTQKTGEGAAELEERLATLAQGGWRLTTTLGSQLILRREHR